MVKVDAATNMYKFTKIRLKKENKKAHKPFFFISFPHWHPIFFMKNLIFKVLDRH